MRKNINRLVFINVALFGFFFLIGANDAFSQCVFVKKENNVEIRVNIPCNFPIITNEIIDLKEVLNTWYINNPTLKNIVILPNSSPGNSFIEIPFFIFDKFPDSKKKTVNSIQYFYKVINKK